MIGFWEWAVTTVLAGIGAAGVLVNEVRRRRHPPRARWDVVRTAEGVLLTNIGDDTARSPVAYGVGCAVELEPRRLIEVGASVAVRIHPEGRPQDAYLVLRWTMAYPRPGRCETRWLPATPDGWLAARLAEQAAANRVQRHLLASAHRKVPGPESCEHASLSTSPARIRRWEADLDSARERRRQTLSLETP